MAPLPGNDGLLSHLMKLTPQTLGQTLGKAMPNLDLPGMPGQESGALTETAGGPACGRAAGGGAAWLHADGRGV